ncbi:Dystrophin, isoforms A/C/F/G [Wickerhamomyces ciferrii]|uniref:Dystrophin, isoforms A/C/F/G n=1 Tax=Wickerhamomyces ciferrii (strain ATCC 14091 / BCRC 22168 / CBS 111 / JCM 3599 / NBRC 0793 / NRRL Y-1031 F-60-10) TaxID=1206466 RepID=K0KXG9_WICCF|nr:Dystrophin, isoforms A/C/F/G [Wickerhamomyces ciferrii]CCH46174.1 Dystrophin, isoforms A/C/F/G [Wickerhamomyces ciferrii]
MTTISPQSSPSSRIRNNMEQQHIPSGSGTRYANPRQHHHTNSKKRVVTPPSRPLSSQQYYQMNKSQVQRSPEQNVFEDSEPINNQNNPKWKIFKSSGNKIYEHKKNGSDDSLPVMPTIAMGYENSIQNQLQSRGELRITNNGYFFEKNEEPRYRYGPGPGTGTSPNQGPTPGPSPGGYFPPQGYQQGPPQGYQNYGYQSPQYYQQYQQAPSFYTPQPEYKEAISAPWEYEKFYNRYENHWRGFDISSQQAPQSIQQQPPTPPEPLIHPVYDPEFRSKPREPRERDDESAQRQKVLESPKRDEGFLKPEDTVNSSNTSIRSDVRPVLPKDPSRESFIARAGPSDVDNEIESTNVSKTPEILIQQPHQTTTISSQQQELSQPVKIQKKKGFLKKMFNTNDSKKKKKKDKRSITPSDQPSNQQLVVPKNLELTPNRQPQSSLSQPVSPSNSTFSQNDLRDGFPTPSPHRSIQPSSASQSTVRRSNRNEDITIMSTLSNIPILSNIFERIDQSNLTPNSKLLVKFALIFWIMYEVNSIFQIFSEYVELISGIFKVDS